MCQPLIRCARCSYRLSILKGSTVLGFAFTCEEIDYLDSRTASEARGARQEGQREAAPEAAASS